MIQCDLIISHLYIRPEELADKTIIVIDTLRATSVITTALANGARSVTCVAEPEEALARRSAEPGLLLGGERNSLPLPGFDFSNSPLDYTRARVDGRDLVMTTSNGTRTLLKAEAGATIFIGCLLNAGAVMEEASALGRDILFINAGTAGQFSLDDYITAGAMLARANGALALTDAARGALLLYQAHPDIHSALTDCLHYNRLLGLGLQADLDYCLSPDRLAVVPRYRAGCVTLHRNR